MSPQTAEKDAEDRQTKCRALNLEPFRAVISISIAQALSLNSPPPPSPLPSSLNAPQTTQTSIEGRRNGRALSP